MTMTKQLSYIGYPITNKKKGMEGQHQNVKLKSTLIHSVKRGKIFKGEIEFTVYPISFAQQKNTTTALNAHFLNILLLRSTPLTEREKEEERN